MRTGNCRGWILLSLFAAATALAQDDLILSNPLPLPPAGRLADGNGEFVLDVSIDPLAGQRLDAGEFVIELRPPFAPNDVVLRNGFENP